MQLNFQAEVDYFDGSDEYTDIVQVKSAALAQWLRDMASDIEQEEIKVLSISITVSGVLPAA